HEEEVGKIGNKMLLEGKIEPKPIKGKAPAIPVNVQAAHDGANLYLKFSWKQPPGGGPKMDANNAVKLAFMLAEDGIMTKDAKGREVDMSKQGGCWATCHEDSRTMPKAKDDKKTKYVVGGKSYDLVQWTSKANKGSDGHVSDKRVMEGGKALVSAKGEKKGDEWSVVFTRKLAGGEGDVALAPGKIVNFGFAIHDDHTEGRFHHVSFGYTLGLDAKADVTATKQ
ncbi:MAG: ethylbenzene dehydrogenase-related protein, partial [Rhodocyclaceae bacterium]|nr:ethylbenzene dehydrogenase-related protein [Rhodocyclaceae bacterium]